MQRKTETTDVVITTTVKVTLSSGELKALSDAIEREGLGVQDKILRGLKSRNEIAGAVFTSLGVIVAGVTGDVSGSDAEETVSVSLSEVLCELEIRTPEELSADTCGESDEPYLIIGSGNITYYKHEHEAGKIETIIFARGADPLDEVTEELTGTIKAHVDEDTAVHKAGTIVELGAGTVRLSAKADGTQLCRVTTLEAHGLSWSAFHSLLGGKVTVSVYSEALTEGVI